MKCKFCSFVDHSVIYFISPARGNKKIIGELPLSFNLIKENHIQPKEKKIDKVYELSSNQEFGTSELANKIKLSQSVPFSKGKERK